jgi:hypothetical protein
MSSTITVIFKSGATQEIPHINRPDAERTMDASMTRTMAGCMRFFTLTQSRDRPAR